MHLIDQFAAIAETYISDSHNNPVFPAPESIRQLRDLKEPLQENPVSPEAVLDLLNEKGSPATVKSTGGRYFGFVTGSSVPAAMMAKMLTAVWDQNSAMHVMFTGFSHAGRNSRRLARGNIRVTCTNSRWFCNRSHHGQFHRPRGCASCSA